MALFFPLFLSPFTCFQLFNYSIEAPELSRPLFIVFTKENCRKNWLKWMESVWNRWFRSKSFSISTKRIEFYRLKDNLRKMVKSHHVLSVQCSDCIVGRLRRFFSLSNFKWVATDDSCVSFRPDTRPSIVFES